MEGRDWEIESDFAKATSRRG